MTHLALLLVLIAACCHAAWNYLTKIVNGGTTFLWLFAVLSTLLYLPLALWILIVWQPVIGQEQIAFMIGSALLHSLYFILLSRGYAIGDLSFIYPLARGTGPLLSIAAAIVFLQERPSLLALSGAALIGLGIVILSGNPLNMLDKSARKPILFALFCGMAIASYTLWDKIAVSTWLVPPLLLDWSANLGRVFLLTPHALQHKQEIRELWQHRRKEAFGVAILCPMAYILVLTAMTFSPVSYIAPAREFSILIGTLLGAKLLSEGHNLLRLAGAGAMVAGLTGLALG